MTNDTDTEREVLRRLIGHRKKKDVASQFGIPGGDSMLSQHLSGNRPISLEAGIKYAKGFGVPLDDLSPRLAEIAPQAVDLLRPRLGQSKDDGRHANDPMTTALKTVLQALSKMSRGQWEMVQRRVDSIIGHPEAAEDAVADLLILFEAAQRKAA